MPIPVTCDCGNEITVADAMAGKKGRCPKCDAVLAIPSGSSSTPKGGAFSAAPRNRTNAGYGNLSVLSTALGILAFLLLLVLAGVGVFTGVTAFRAPENFQGPLGLFGEYADQVQDQPTLFGFIFIVGGIVAGALVFLALSAAAQSIRLFLSIEHSLGSIAEHLDGPRTD